MQLPECLFPIVVICIDHDKRLVDQILCGKNRLTGPPWLYPSLRHHTICRNVMQILKGICQLYAQPCTHRLQPASDPLPEIRLNILADHKYNLIKSGLDRIMDRIIHNDLIVHPDRLQLLDPASEARTNSRCHNQ